MIIVCFFLLCLFMLRAKQEDAKEKKLLLSLKNGDSNALSSLYDLYVDQLYFFVLKTAKSPELAEDVLQDVFIKIWENRSSIDPTKTVKPYLYTVARRHLLNLLKRASHEKVIIDKIKQYTPLSERSTDIQLDFAETNTILNDALDQLGPRSRAVFVLCKLEGLTYKQVADQMGIAEGTVNSQVVKATKSIKKYFNLRELLLILILFFR